MYIRDIERVDKVEEAESSSRGKSINIWKYRKNFYKLYIKNIVFQIKNIILFELD